MLVSPMCVCACVYMCVCCPFLIQLSAVMWLARHLKITDFGTSKVLDQASDVRADGRQKKRGSFVGTAEYVSPEVLNDEHAGRP